jgi:hypothetical protein
MIKRINRHKAIISLMFLSGYFSFLILTITHFHITASNRNGGTPGIVYKTLYSTNSDTQENCQICYSFFSINFNSVITAFSSGLLIESCALSNNFSNYKTNPVDKNYLRGPPSLNIFSI